MQNHNTTQAPCHVLLLCWCRWTWTTVGRSPSLRVDFLSIDCWVLSVSAGHLSWIYRGHSRYKKATGIYKKWNGSVCGTNRCQGQCVLLPCPLAMENLRTALEMETVGRNLCNQLKSSVWFETSPSIMGALEGLTGKWKAPIKLGFEHWDMWLQFGLRVVGSVGGSTHATLT